MKRTLFLGLCCLAAVLLSAATVYAQVGGFTGQAQVGGGFTGPVVTSQQALVVPGMMLFATAVQSSTFPHKTPVSVSGNIVGIVGNDLFLFRDASGETLVKIGRKEWQWFGETIGTSDKIELRGEVSRDKKTGQFKYVKGKYLKRL